MYSKRNQKMCLTIGLAFLFSMAGNAKADFTFGEPTNLGPTINSPNSECCGSFSSDGLEMYFDSNRIGGSWDTGDIYMSIRATTDDAWGTPVKLGPPVNRSGLDVNPIISTDGLSLYFTSLNRAGGYGFLDIWVATRATVSDPWGEPSNLGPTINTSQDDVASSISCDGLVLYLYPVNRPGGYGDYDIWVSTRATTNDAWGEPVNLGPIVNSSDGDGWPYTSADGLLLFFHSNRPGGFGDYDLYMTMRATVSDPWGIPVNLGPTVSSSDFDYGPTISPDGSTLFFTSNRPGGCGETDIWQAPIIPIVDLNSDGMVDCTDMCIMVDHWGENYSLCDIGPTPLGDGTVDIEDLKVLSEHLFTYPGAVAYWKLDETEGMFASDSVGDNDAIFVTGATWQPNSGQIDGAIQLNGIDGYAITGPIMDPADSPFSIFAWIKGEAPGQVVVSQQNVANWLATDEDGNLMTELKSSDPLAGPLISETVITDGQWHRIGLVWHGSYRTLYVDGVAVAEDTQLSLESSQMGLYIGVDKNFTPGTFFSGLIDDVRIYNRAVSP